MDLSTKRQSMVGGRRRGSRGNAILEFAVVALFLMPLLLGTFTLGHCCPAISPTGSVG